MEARNNNSIKQENVSFTCDDNACEVSVNELISKIETTSRQTFNETKSLFNTTLDECYNAKDAIEQCKEYAQQEQKEWLDILRSSSQNMKETIAQNVSVSTRNCKPSQVQQAYLNNGPNLDNYMRGAVGFMNDATIFLEVEHDEMLELQDSVMDNIQYRVNVLSSNSISENLAKENVFKNK